MNVQRVMQTNIFRGDVSGVPNEGGVFVSTVIPGDRQGRYETAAFYAEDFDKPAHSGVRFDLVVQEPVLSLTKEAAILEHTMLVMRLSTMYRADLNRLVYAAKEKWER